MAFRRVAFILFLNAFILSANSVRIETPNYSHDEYKTFLNTIWDLTSTLGANTPDLCIQKTLIRTGIELVFSTQDDFKYHYFPVKSTSMQFAVKASSDVYIAFSSKPFEAKSTELIIGASNNTKTLFQHNDFDKEEVKTPGILNHKEYRSFRVRWSDGIILVWRTGEHRPIITWVLPQAVPIGYIGVRTGDGVRGSWYIQDLSVGTIKKGSNDTNILQFKVKSRSDAHIGFFTAPGLFQGQMIEILIGGWANTKTLIRRGNFKFNDVVTVELPGILNGSEYRGFWIQWGDVISVGREGEHCPFMTWPDPEPFQVTHLGIHTGYGTSGSWKIEDWDEIETPDSMDYMFQPFAALSGISAAIDT